MRVYLSIEGGSGGRPDTSYSERVPFEKDWWKKVFKVSVVEMVEERSI